MSFSSPGRNTRTLSHAPWRAKAQSSKELPAPSHCQCASRPKALLEDGSHRFDKLRGVAAGIVPVISPGHGDAAIKTTPTEGHSFSLDFCQIPRRKLDCRVVACYHGGDAKKPSQNHREPLPRPSHTEQPVGFGSSFKMPASSGTLKGAGHGLCRSLRLSSSSWNLRRGNRPTETAGTRGRFGIPWFRVAFLPLSPCVVECARTETLPNGSNHVAAFRRNSRPGIARTPAW